MRTRDHTAIALDYDPRSERIAGYTAHGNHFFDAPYISRVAPDLYQGGCATGLVLPTDIVHVVSLYPWERYTVRHDLESSLTVRMYDASEWPDVDQVLHLANHVNLCRRTGPTLVHCQAGLNRSGLIAAAALWAEGMDMGEAVALLREARSPAVLCNETFEAFLMDLGGE